MWKKKDRTKQKQKVHNIISVYCGNLFHQAKSKLRLKGRIVLANRYAKKNPKKFAGTFAISMIFIFALNFFSLAYNNAKTDENNSINNLMEINSTFNGMTKLQNNRETIKEHYEKIIKEGLNLTNRLDSLNNLNYKSPSDSVEIVFIINRLNVINKILAHEKN